jgi:antitoxin HigA-1
MKEEKEGFQNRWQSVWQRLLILKLIVSHNLEIIIARIPTHRTPTHPGEMLLEEFLKPMGINQRELSKAINVPYQRIKEIINGKRGITPSTALRLAKVFGVSADFWMNIQLRWDLFFAKEGELAALKNIKPLSTYKTQSVVSDAHHSA